MRQTSVVLFATALLAACAAPPKERPVMGRVSALPPIQHPADNPSTPAKVALGAQLVLDKRLSGSGNNNCQSCHYRELGWTDANVLSKRDNGDLNTRHTPSLHNVGHQSLWCGDGRAVTMEAQTLTAWRNQMSVDPAVPAARINAVPAYASQFKAGYGAPASPDTIVKSLTAYLRTKNSENSPWDRYEMGDVKAVSKDAVEGWQLFSGKGACTTCHAPPFCGNSSFFNIGLEHGKEKPDPGRFNVTKNEADRGAFKTPSLRSVALGAPYFHDGQTATLKEAVRFKSGLMPLTL